MQSLNCSDRNARRGAGAAALRGPLALAGVLLAVAPLTGCAERNAESTDHAAPPTPITREVKVFFLREAVCEVYPVSRIVTAARSVDLARAALESLVAGPTEEEVAGGYRSRIPDRDQVWRYRQSRLAFGQMSPYPGDEVRLLDVREMEHQLLWVNFSPELVAYGRGEDRVCEVIRQIEATVQQFDEYRNVSIAVDGRHRGVLQP